VPPYLLWRQARAAGMAVRAARERTFCRTREPAGVLEMLAWSPAVQKSAGLLSRSCRNRRDRTRTWSGNFSSLPLKVDSIF
jgi:hypothetical protein